MVRGSLYVSGDGYRVRRAASVPVEDFSPSIDRNVTHHARIISSHAVQDADALRAASKQQDINFLNDVSNKLAAAAQPRYYKESTPVYIGSRPPGHSVDERRRTWYDNDYEVNNYLEGTRLRSRGGTPVRGPSVPRWAPSPSRAGRAGSRGPSYSRENLAPYEDVVVGVAHTSLYGDIVIGIPYHKKHMFNLDDDSTKSTSYRTYPSNGQRHSIAPSSYPTIGSVVVHPGVRRSSISVPSAHRRALHDDVNDYLSSSTPRYTQPVQRYAGSEYTQNYPGSRSSLTPSRASSVHRQLDGSSGYGGYSGYTPSVSVPSYGGVSSSLPPSGSAMPPKSPRKYSRPPVSDARRKVRDLLCKSKNDPHYYDEF